MLKECKLEEAQASAEKMATEPSIASAKQSESSLEISPLQDSTLQARPDAYENATISSSSNNEDPNSHKYEVNAVSSEATHQVPGSPNIIQKANKCLDG